MTAPQRNSDEHTAIAPALDRDEARGLIEDLEDQGVPATAIELDEPGPENPPQRRAAPVFGDIARSVLAAAGFGVVAGAALGLLVGAVTDTELMLAATAGAAFGAFVGVVAGGIRVVRFASPAWRDASSAEKPRLVRVVVQHPEREVVDTAAEVMSTHGHQPEVRIIEG